MKNVWAKDESGQGWCRKAEEAGYEICFLDAESQADPEQPDQISEAGFKTGCRIRRTLFRFFKLEKKGESSTNDCMVI